MAAGRGTQGGAGAASFKDAFFRNFFISLLDASPLVKWDPRDDAIDKSFFMSLLEDRTSNRPTVGMVMAAVIATGNNKEYYPKIHKWIKKQPNAEPNQLVCKQLGYIMKLAEYIIKTVSQSDVEYWKKILVEAWYKHPQKDDDIWHMIFGNYWPNSKQLTIKGKDAVYVKGDDTATNGNGNEQVDDSDEIAFEKILDSHTSGKKTVGVVLEAIIAAKQNHQRYNKIIQWIGKISPPKLTPPLAKQFLHYRKLSDYLATDSQSERESQYWGDILGNTEYQLPHDTKDIWPSIFGNAAPNVLTLSFVGKSHVYKKNPVAMPPKKSVTPPPPKEVSKAPPKEDVKTPPKEDVKTPPKEDVKTPPEENVKAPPKENVKTPLKEDIKTPPTPVKENINVPIAKVNIKDRITVPQKEEKPPAPKPAAKLAAPQQEIEKESEEDGNIFNEEYFNNILKSNNSRTKSVGTVLAAVIAANQKEDRYEKVITWIGKSKPPKLNVAIAEQFLFYRNLSEYLTKSVPAEDTQYWLELLRDTEYQLPLSSTEIWPSIFGKAVPNVLKLSITYKGEIYKKVFGTAPVIESPKVETVSSIAEVVSSKAEATSSKAETVSPKAEIDSSVKGGKHIEVALLGDAHIWNLPCRRKETIQCEYGSYTLVKYCDRKARPDFFHNTRAWNDFKVSKPNVVILFLGGSNITRLPNARNLAGTIIYYEKKILEHTNIRNDRFFVIGLEKRKNTPLVYWESYRNSVNEQLSKHFGDQNFFVFDQEDGEIDQDGRNMSKAAYIRLLDCIKDAAVSVLQFGEEVSQDDTTDSSVNGATTAETKMDVDVKQAAAETKKVDNVKPAVVETKKVEDVQHDTKKVEPSNTSSSYNKSPQKRQQQEQGNKANVKKLATENKVDSSKSVVSNEVDDEFQILLNKTVGKKSITVVLEAVDAAKKDKTLYHRILKWIGVSRFMTPVLEKQLNMYCKLSEYLKEDLPQPERDYWKKTLESGYEPPSKSHDDVFGIINIKAPNTYRITMKGKDKVYKEEKPAAKLEAKPTAGKASPPKDEKNNDTKASPAESSDTSESQITVTMIGDSSISSFPGKPTEVIKGPAGSYTLKRFCKLGVGIDDFPKGSEWSEMIGSDANIVLVSLGGDSLEPFVSKQMNPRTISDKLLQRRRDIMKATKLPPNCVYLVGLGKKESSDKYWEQCRTEVNQFLEKVLTKKQFFLPEQFFIDATHPNVNKVAYENLQKFIQQAYNNFKKPGVPPTIQNTEITPGKGNVDNKNNQMSANEKAANIISGSGDLRNMMKRNVPTPPRNVPTPPRNVPANQKNVPATQKNVPANQKNVPANQKNVPANQRNSPVNQRNVPVNQRNVPFNQRNVPFNQRNSPVNQRNVPVNQRNSPLNQRNVPVNPVLHQTQKQANAHNYLKNFGKTQAGGNDQSNQRNSPGNIHSRLGGIVTNNQDHRNQLGAGKQQGGQDLRNLLARGQTGRQQGAAE